MEPILASCGDWWWIPVVFLALMVFFCVGYLALRSGRGCPCDAPTRGARP